jgi:hypothetical protein
MLWPFAIFILFATASPAHATTLFPAGAEPEDVQLLADCRLLLAHPDMRTPMLRQQIQDASRQREKKWAELDNKSAAGRDDTMKDAQEATRIACGWALGAGVIAKVDRLIAMVVNVVTSDRVPKRSAPEIEPWPPPIPTDQATFTANTDKFKTVGDFSDSLMRRLNGAGILNLRFWGAPDGVAVVVPLEQIDDSARPVRKTSAASVSAAQPAGPVGSIFEGFHQLLSEPIRVSRILLFVLTDDSSAKVQTVRMTTEIASDWTHNSYMRPDVNRTVPLTDQHFVLVNVYEFRKEDRGDPDLLAEKQKIHSVAEHLAASQVSVAGLVK